MSASVSSTAVCVNFLYNNIRWASVIFGSEKGMAGVVTVQIDGST